MSHAKAATGLFTIIVGSTTVAVTTESVEQFLHIITGYLPLLATFALSYIVYRLGKEHKNCRDSLLDMNIKLASLKTEFSLLKARCSSCSTRDKILAQGYKLVRTSSKIDE